MLSLLNIYAHFLLLVSHNAHSWYRLKLQWSSGRAWVTERRGQRIQCGLWKSVPCKDPHTWLLCLVCLSSHMGELTQAVQVSQKSAVVRAELYSAVAWCCGAEWHGPASSPLSCPAAGPGSASPHSMVWGTMLYAVRFHSNEISLHWEENGWMIPETNTWQMHISNLSPPVLSSLQLSCICQQQLYFQFIQEILCFQQGNWNSKAFPEVPCPLQLLVFSCRWRMLVTPDPGQHLNPHLLLDFSLMLEVPVLSQRR